MDRISYLSTAIGAIALIVAAQARVIISDFKRGTVGAAATPAG